MAEETVKKETIKQPENPMLIDVERNGKTIKLTEQRTTRGAVRGKVVFDPDTTDAQSFLDSIGIDNVVGIVRQRYRQLSIGWAEEATDEDTNEFNKSVFIQLAQSFDASGETIGELEEQQEEAKSNMLKCDQSKLASNDPAEVQKFLKYGMECNRLQVAINKKSRPRKVKTPEVVNA